MDSGRNGGGKSVFRWNLLRSIGAPDWLDLQVVVVARPLGDILNRFETETEHEFVFSGGPSQSLGEEEEE